MIYSQPGTQADGLWWCTKHHEVEAVVDVDVPDRGVRVEYLACVRCGSPVTDLRQIRIEYELEQMEDHR